MVKDVFILGGKRTPMGEYVGALKDISAIELGAIAARGALETTGVAPDQIDHTVMPARGSEPRLFYRFQDYLFLFALAHQRNDVFLLSTEGKSDGPRAASDRAAIDRFNYIAFT
jgi:hypothetical protein